MLDRFIQQLVRRVLQADWDGTFSEVNFVLVTKRVADGRLLKLIHAFLNAGVMGEGSLVRQTRAHHGKTLQTQGQERGCQTEGSKFLGFSFITGEKLRRPMALVRFKAKVRERTARRTRSAASTSWLPCSAYLESARSC